MGRALCDDQRTRSFAGHVVLRNQCFDLATFVPTEDALERMLLSIAELMRRYCGPVEVLAALVEGARARLEQRN